MTPNVIIHQLTWDKAQHEASQIRRQVFIQEQQVTEKDEWDGEDEQAIHFLVQSATGEAIATARILREEHHQLIAFHIGRVAVLKEHRNQGIGHLLLQTLIHWCLADSVTARIYLHAQIERRRFYETLGFIAEGEIFIDAGIQHIAMHFLKRQQ